jgi:hypothetical protein
MKRLFNRSNSSFSKTRKPQSRSLRLETLEDRRMKSVNPLLAVGAAQTTAKSAPTKPATVQASTAQASTVQMTTAQTANAQLTPALIGKIPPVQAQMAQGSITLDSTGTINVLGSDTLDDTVTISIDNRGTSSTADDMVKVTLANVFFPQTVEFSVASVKGINVKTFGGNDYVDNQTSIPMYADGGAGNDTLLGGSGCDTLFGGSGAGNDYLDGRAGNDMLIAGSGTDELFGDDGNDSLYGSSTGKDYMFGGNGNDQLYGEGNNGFLFGEGGTDVLIDYTGTNKDYQDYGPVGAVVDQFENFDWFDRNLTDPTVRSLARLEYSDMQLSRTDMLNIFSEIGQDGSVSANEFSDLQKISATNLTKPADVQFLANAVINGDPANAHYLGAALGNLKAGSSAAQLNDLTGKWFEGTDLPAAGDGVYYAPVSGSLFVNGPSYTDIEQGSLGDCYFMSALGEVAQYSPQTITSMFIDNGDGTYAVRFFHGSSEAFVTVNSKLPILENGTATFAGWGFNDAANNPYYDSGNELWVALAEKAYVQLNESGWTGHDGTNNYFGITAGDPAAAYSQITGKSATDYGIAGPSASLGASMATMLSDGHALMLTTKTDQSALDPGDLANHQYMIVGYNAANKTFEVVDPHNYNHAGGNTVVQWLDWDQIGHNFAFLTECVI